MAPTKLGAKAGTSITVETAILALVTKSANDAAAASGELHWRFRSPFCPDDDSQGALDRHAQARAFTMHRVCPIRARSPPRATWPCLASRCAPIFRNITNIFRCAPSPMAARALPTTTSCLAALPVLTASRPVTPACPASILFPPCPLTTRNWLQWFWAANPVVRATRKLQASSRNIMPKASNRASAGFFAKLKSKRTVVSR